MDPNPTTPDSNALPPATAGGSPLTPDLLAQAKQWLAPVGIAVAVIAAVFLYRHQKESGEAKASRMLGEARNTAAFQAVLSQYPRTSAAALAQLQLAKAQYDNGDLITAQSSYDEFLRKHADHPLAAIATVGQIQCQEALGQTVEALAAYDAFVAAQPDHFLTPTALFAKARCLRNLERLAEARAVYEDFLVAHPKSQWQGEIEEELKQLERVMKRSNTNGNAAS
jgi:outer membrane protein assembly factor BamD (BamD/ComL family)